QIPSTVTVGTTKISLIGLSSILTSTGTTNEIEVSVNGGTAQYLNLSKTYSINGATLMVGSYIIKNSTGDFLNSLGVSTANYVQNLVNGTTKKYANVFGLGAYNATASAGKIIFYGTANETLPYSFTSTSSFSMPAGLTNVSLQKLTPVYNRSKGAYNLTVTVGKPGVFSFVPVVNNTKLPSSLATMAFNYTNSIPNIQFGIDYRGTFSSSTGLYGPADLLLEHYSSNYFTSTGKYITGYSEYIYPTPTRTPIWKLNTTGFNGTSGKVHAITFNETYGLSTKVSTVGIARPVIELPNGDYLALQLKNVTVGNTSASGSHARGYSWNITTVLNYTAATVANPTVYTNISNISKLS
ncbi:MAG: hypothetical protein RAK22_03055, partial [Nanoarchaeota archaeon]|nr:hypothetical protein [Nanoarchaeota archaeon]